MGCLFELIGEIVMELITELVLSGYIKLMCMIVPEKDLSEKTREKIKKTVTKISAVLLSVLIAGFILMLLANTVPVLGTLGKILFYCSLTVICSQIILGILMKIINKKSNGDSEEE